MRVTLSILTLLLLVSCSKSTQLNRGDGTKQFLVECGASTAWSICYEEANKVCPSGYSDLSKSAGFNRKEMVVECK